MKSLRRFSTHGFRGWMTLCSLLAVICSLATGCIAHVYQEYVQDVRLLVTRQSNDSPVSDCELGTVDRPFVEEATTDSGGKAVMQIASTSYQALPFHWFHTQPDMVTNREFTITLRGIHSSEQIRGVFRPGARLEGGTLVLWINCIDHPKVVESLEYAKKSEPLHTDHEP